MSMTRAFSPTTHPPPTALPAFFPVVSSFCVQYCSTTWRAVSTLYLKQKNFHRCCTYKKEHTNKTLFHSFLTARVYFSCSNVTISATFSAVAAAFLAMAQHPISVLLALTDGCPVSTILVRIVTPCYSCKVIRWLKNISLSNSWGRPLLSKHYLSWYRVREQTYKGTNWTKQKTNHSKLARKWGGAIYILWVVFSKYSYSLLKEGSKFLS